MLNCLHCDEKEEWEFIHAVERFLLFLLSVNENVVIEKESRELMAYINETTKSDSTKPVNLKEVVKRIREIVGDSLSVGQLDFLGELGNFTKLIRFFADIGKDFDSRAAIVCSQHVGSQHESEVINNMIRVHMKLQKLIQAIRRGEKASLGELCRTLEEIAPKDSTTQSQVLEEIGSVHAKVNEVMSWFMDLIPANPSIESLYPLVRTVRKNKRGRFELYFEPGPAAVHLRLVLTTDKKEEGRDSGLEEDIVISERELEEHIRGVKIFLKSELVKKYESDESMKEDMVKAMMDIEDYMRAYGLLWEIGKIYKELVDSGYPSDIVEGQKSHE